MACGTRALDHAEAVQPGHPDVCDHELKPLRIRRQLGDRFCAVAGTVGREPGRFDRRKQHFQERGAVFYTKDAGALAWDHRCTLSRSADADSGQLTPSIPRAQRAGNRAMDVFGACTRVLAA